MKRNFILIALIASVAIVAGCTDNMEPDQDLSDMEDQPTQDSQEDISENETSSEEETGTVDNATEETTSNTTNTSGTANESEVREIVVEGGNYYFENRTINVEQGETVRIVLENVEGFHDLRIPEKEVGTDQINAGETDSFTVSFDETGSYEFICSVGNHAARGMIGNIEVS